MVGKGVDSAAWSYSRSDQGYCVPLLCRKANRIWSNDGIDMIVMN